MKNISIGNRVYRVSESIYQELHRLSNTLGLDEDTRIKYENEIIQILTNIEDSTDPVLMIDSSYHY